MKRRAKFPREAQAFCEKLNPGLTAVALVLAIVVAAQASARLGEAANDAGAAALAAWDPSVPIAACGGA